MLLKNNLYIYKLLIAEVTGFEPIMSVLETDMLPITLYFYKAEIVGLEPTHQVLSRLLAV